MNIDKVSSFMTQVDELTKKPEKYLSLQNQEAEIIKTLTRDLYNFTKENENSKKGMTDALKQLVINNLDEEQIWQQVELQNSSICNTLLHDIAHLLAKKDSLKFPVKDKKKKQVKKLSEEKDDKNNLKEVRKTEVKEKKKTKQVNRKKVKSSVVDDKFFKLHEMENFLEKVERGEDNDSDDSDIDYFEEESSDTNCDSGEQLHYNDFFDQPEEDDKGSKASTDDYSDENKASKRVKFMLNENEGEDDSDDNDDDDDDFDDADLDDDDNKEKNENLVNGSNSEGDEDPKNNSNERIYDDDLEDEDDNDNNDDDNDEDDDGNKLVKQPSTFEARQERLKIRIENLEKEALREKPWQLKGEVTASNRPQNSLLEEYVEFDIATRPAPVFTETSTLKLEDVIIQRIKDKAWDDVIRKIKPVESDIEYKKRLVLDQEKSKLSLAQIYEQEYLKQLDGKNEEQDKPEVEPPEHQEIRIMMKKLFSKLDALSNFHFTPKQVSPEVKIVSNLPAISMEEVAPVAMSDAALLAPEEVRPKSKGDLVGKSERTKTDKKRERRQKKLKQKIKYKQMEAKSKLKSEKSDSKDPEKKKISQAFLQKITKSSNVTQLQESEGGKYIKSSNAFFSKLQNEASSVINKGLTGKKATLGKNVSSNKKQKKIR